MSLKPGYLGLRRPRDGKICSISKKVGGKRKQDVQFQKNRKNWDVKSQKRIETQVRETMKMPYTVYNNTKIASKKKGKNWGKKRMSH